MFGTVYYNYFPPKFLEYVVENFIMIASTVVVKFQIKKCVRLCCLFLFLKAENCGSR